MKIEKVNDNQIRCTLTKADLADREIKLSELAYGTEKAKSLFRDMMQQAAIKFGFEADNIPLMIEAIPLNADCIVLIITKVEDPEELDTRFSRFAPSEDDTDDGDDVNLDETISRSHDEVLDLFKRIKKQAAEIATKNLEQSVEDEAKSAADGKKDAQDEPKFAAKIFSFNAMTDVIKPSVALKDVYDDQNSLYKDEKNGRYYLVINKIKDTTEAFNRACNILSEYGKLERMLPSSEYFFKEHYVCVIENNAIQSLSKIK